MYEFRLPEPIHCYRCGYSWNPRHAVVRMCPRCKSRVFDEPRLRVPTYGTGLGIEDVIGRHRSEVLRCARQYGARNVRVFGSVGRKVATPTSDVDLLVDRIPGRLLHRVELALAIQKIIGRDVDLVTEDSLHWFVEPQVLAEAVPL